MLSILVRHDLQKSCLWLTFLRTTLPSNVFLLPIRSPRILFRPYATIGSCSNAVLRFEFICVKLECVLVICFTFGNVLLYDITKGIIFWSFDFFWSYAICASNAFLSISDGRWNSISRNVLLNFFLESSEVSVQIFFRQRVWLYGILFISDLG